MKHKQEFEV